MAKTLKVQTIFGEDLDKLAEKFGKIPTSYTKSADIIAAGFLTQEEFDNLPYCPRSTPMVSATAWPKIGGRKTYPLSGALNSEESEMYYAYKREHKPGTGTGSIGSSGKIDENKQKIIDSIRQFLKDNNAGDLIQQFEEIIPHRRVGLLEEMFGTDNPALLKKCNYFWLMYRGPNGEFYEKNEPTIEDLGKMVMAGFMPKFTQEQIKQNVEKLLKAGIDVRGCIIGY